MLIPKFILIIPATRSLMNIEKSVEEMTSSCLTPQFMLINSVYILLILTQESVKESKDLTAKYIFPFILNFTNFENNKSVFM